MGVARGHRTVQLSEDILLSLEGIVNEHNGAQPDAKPLMEVRRYLAEIQRRRHQLHDYLRPIARRRGGSTSAAPR
jgi:hypothetical protein